MTDASPPPSDLPPDSPSGIAEAGAEVGGPPPGSGGSSRSETGPKPWLWIVVAAVVVIGIVVAVIVGGGDDADSGASGEDGVEALDDPDAEGAEPGGDGSDGDGSDGDGSDGEGTGSDGSGADDAGDADGSGDGPGDGSAGGPDGDGGEDGAGGGSGGGASPSDGGGANGSGDAGGGGGSGPGGGGSQTPGSPSGEGFGDGTYIVGEDIEPGLYRSSTTGACYWARLSGLAGDLDDIIANGLDSPEIVAVLPEDEGFETQECGQWTPVAATVPDTPATSFGDGTYLVGEHIEPGTYTPDGDDEFCYWARLSDFEHVFDGIIANGMGPAPVEVLADDVGFSAFGCGTYTRS